MNLIGIGVMLITANLVKGHQYRLEKFPGFNYDETFQLSQVDCLGQCSKETNCCAFSFGLNVHNVCHIFRNCNQNPDLNNENKLEIFYRKDVNHQASPVQSISPTAETLSTSTNPRIIPIPSVTAAKPPVGPVPPPVVIKPVFPVPAPPVKTPAPSASVPPVKATIPPAPVSGIKKPVPPVPAPPAKKPVLPAPAPLPKKPVPSPPAPPVKIPSPPAPAPKPVVQAPRPPPPASPFDPIFSAGKCKGAKKGVIGNVNKPLIPVDNPWTYCPACAKHILEYKGQGFDRVYRDISYTYLVIVRSAGNVCDLLVECNKPGNSAKLQKHNFYLNGNNQGGNNYVLRITWDGGKWLTKNDLKKSVDAVAQNIQCK